MRIPTYLFAALAALVTQNTYAVYKCKGPAGATIYQDQPCESAGGPITTKPNGAEVDRQALQEAQKAAIQRKKPISELDPSSIKIDRDAIYYGLMGGKPVVGMNLTQLDMALGKPNKITSEYRDGYSAQVYVYRRKGMWYDIYVREGMVVRILSETR